MKWKYSNITALNSIDAKEIIKIIEYACRTCYQSYDKITIDSAAQLIKNAIARGHESVLEHQQLTFKVECSRSCLAQWTRHRLASYSVESQRYCNYSKDKFGGQINYIYPFWYKDIEHIVNCNKSFKELTENEKTKLNSWNIIKNQCMQIEKEYVALIKNGAKPEEARCILPQNTACTMIFSANIRELRHFIKLRTAAGAEPEIKYLAKQLLELLKDAGLGVLFEDIEV